MGYDVTHLQEVHGNLTQMYHFFNRFKSSHWLVLNPHAHDGSGGAVSLYKRITFGSVKPRQLILVKGRVAFAWFAFGRRLGRSATFRNIHDFAFSLTDWIRTRKFILGRIDKALTSPENHFLWISGDAGRYAAGGGSSFGTSGSFKRIAEIDVVMRNMVLLEHMGYSRYDQASDSLCTLDHSFCSLRPWQMNQTLIVQKECNDCRALHFDGVSDHAPMGFEIESKSIA
jgi:hypothetical protein